MPEMKRKKEKKRKEKKEEKKAPAYFGLRRSAKSAPNTPRIIAEIALDFLAVFP